MVGIIQIAATTQAMATRTMVITAMATDVIAIRAVTATIGATADAGTTAIAVAMIGVMATAMIAATAGPVTGAAETAGTTRSSAGCKGDVVAASPLCASSQERSRLLIVNLLKHPAPTTAIVELPFAIQVSQLGSSQYYGAIATE